MGSSAGDNEGHFISRKPKFSKSCAVAALDIRPMLVIDVGYLLFDWKWRTILEIGRGGGLKHF
jgi:hypothetical protein